MDIFLSVRKLCGVELFEQEGDECDRLLVDVMIVIISRIVILCDRIK